jgi:hypothetical protein
VEHTALTEKKRHANSAVSVWHTAIVGGRGKDEETNSDKDGKSRTALQLYIAYRTYIYKLGFVNNVSGEKA